MGYEKACTTDSCLKKFIVHFRRSSNYKGEYGFDWVREDYIYKNLKLNNSTSTNNPFESVGGQQQNGSVEICNEFNLLKKKYLTYPNPIKPYGFEYFAAWCSLFSADISSRNSKGINLSLQVEEIEKISQDGTILEFESTTKSIVITPKSISMNRVLSGIKKKIKKGGSQSNSFYLNNVVNLKCVKSIAKVEQIKVYAKRNGTRKEVGKLNVYKNNIVKKTEIIIVPVSFDNGADTPKINPNLLSILKNNCFNQAIIEASVRVAPVMDVRKIIINSSKNKLMGAHQIAQYNYLWLNKKIISEEMYLRFFRSFYSNYVDRNAKIDKGDSAKKTYVFVTKRQVETGSNAGLYGIASHVDGQNKLSWGDFCIIFQQKRDSPYHYIHEIAHTFGLEHSFQNSKYDKNKLTFRQGYTDNSIDYTWIPSDTMEPKINILSMLNNGCFFYWQWDVMRNDRSMK